VSNNSLVKEPPKGFLRWLLRMPIFLYRNNLGWLLGKRFVLLNHIGRKSGLPRQVVVEVVEHDEASHTVYVASGWGHQAQWYQNLLAQPDFTIQMGRRTWAVHAKMLTPEEAAAILRNYRQKHPTAARELSRVMGLDMVNSSDEELLEIIRESLPMVALIPRNE
jgi:deazaflavin-dependent oxidoreductase (nitroreductase family)